MKPGIRAAGLCVLVAAALTAPAGTAAPSPAEADRPTERQLLRSSLRQTWDDAPRWERSTLCYGWQRADLRADTVRRVSGPLIRTDLVKPRVVRHEVRRLLRHSC